MILASPPRRTFEPVWSGCQWVLKRVWILPAPVAWFTCLSSSREDDSGPPSTSATPAGSRQATTLAPPETNSHRLSPSFCGAAGLPAAASAGYRRPREAAPAPRITVLIKLLRLAERVMAARPVKGLSRVLSDPIYPCGPH